MYEIDPSDVDGYESNDSEYAAQLWDYKRRYLTVEDLIDLLANSFSQSGIEALEREVLEGFSRELSQYRPPARSGAAFSERVRHRLEEMPPRLALYAWHSEVEVWFGRSAKEGQMTMLSLLEVAEEVFDVDLTDEIVEEVAHMEECETKLDVLEARGAIDGDEWYERHEALNEEEKVIA